MATILVPFDGREASEIALELACSNAYGTGEEVRAAYVIRVPYQLPISAELPAEHSTAAAVLARAVAIGERYDALLDTMVIEARQRGPAIVAAARDCDCIMMGHHGKRFFKQLVLDRTLRYVMAHAPCPVLVSYLPPRGESVRRFFLAPAVTAFSSATPLPPEPAIARVAGITIGGGEQAAGRAAQ